MGYYSAKTDATMVVLPVIFAVIVIFILLVVIGASLEWLKTCNKNLLCKLSSIAILCYTIVTAILFIISGLTYYVTKNNEKKQKINNYAKKTFIASNILLVPFYIAGLIGLLAILGQSQAI